MQDSHSCDSFLSQGWQNTTSTKQTHFSLFLWLFLCSCYHHASVIQCSILSCVCAIFIPCLSNQNPLRKRSLLHMLWHITLLFQIRCKNPSKKSWFVKTNFVQFLVCLSCQKEWKIMCSSCLCMTKLQKRGENLLEILYMGTNFEIKYDKHREILRERVWVHDKHIIKIILTY